MSSDPDDDTLDRDRLLFRRFRLRRPWGGGIVAPRWGVPPAGWDLWACAAGTPTRLDDGRALLGGGSGESGLRGRIWSSGEKRICWARVSGEIWGTEGIDGGTGAWKGGWSGAEGDSLLEEATDRPSASPTRAGCCPCTVDPLVYACGLPFP